MRLSKPAWLLHLSLAVIVAGGLVTWLTGDKGQVTLGAGESVTAYRSDDGDERPFPFVLSLDSFRVGYYPGGEVPRTFTSYLRVDGERAEVSVNNIVSVSGYRLCQLSYDSSMRTVLGVNHDPAGIAVTYTGYALFAVAGLWLLFSRRGGFRRSLRRLGAVALLVACGASGMRASTIAGIPRGSADSLARRQVLYNGRLMTFNSLARDFTLKITGGTTYRGVTPEQFMGSWLLYPERWRAEKAVLIKDAELRRRLGIEGKYASVNDLFDADGGYRLRALYGKGDRRLDRAIEETDEKTGLLMQLLSGGLIVARPAEMAPMSARRVEAEIFYNSVPLSAIVSITLFAGSAAGFVALLLGRPGLRRVALAALYAGFAVQLAAYCLKWYVSGHLPVSNTGETMEFLVLVLLALLMALCRRNRLLLPMGLLLAGAVALVARLTGANPVMTPLVPVLRSPWMGVHVTLVMTSYALLAFTVLVAVAAFMSRRQAAGMMWLGRALLYPAVYLLGLGIITGAVWANISWGRYWAWDPKETWALVTFLVYAVPLHRSIRALQSPRVFHGYMLVAFLAVLMTYFGVNALSSLHAYS